MPEIVTALDTGITGSQNTPNNLYNSGAYGDAQVVSGGGTGTNLLAPDVQQQIIRALNEKWLDIAYLRSRTVAGSPAFIRFETPWVAQQLVITVNAGAGAPDTPVTYTSTDGSLGFYGPNYYVMFSNGQHGIITAKPTTTTVTIAPLAGESLPAVVAGDATAILGNAGILGADGSNAIRNVLTPELVQYDYVVQKFGPYVEQINPWEKVRFMRNGTTNYLVTKARLIYDSMMAALQHTIWLGTRGVTTLADGQTAWTTSGIREQILNAGVPEQAVTPATFYDVLMDTYNNTIVGANPNKVLFCSPRVADYVSQATRGYSVRTTVENTTFGLKVTRYSFMSGDVTVVPSPSFEDQGSNGAVLRNRAFLVNEGAIALHHVEGSPMMSTRRRLINQMDDPAGTLGSEVYISEGNVCPVLDYPSFSGLFAFSL